MAKLGNQRVVGRAVERERNVIADHRNEQERAVDPACVVDWTPKHEHGDECERKGRELEERHATAGFRRATVGKACHCRIHECVEEAGERGDAADHCHYAKHGKALRHEHGLPLRNGFVVGLVEVDEPIRNNAGK